MFMTNPNLAKSRFCHFFGVCDGHGAQGHTVSNLIASRLPFLIEEEVTLLKKKPKDLTNGNVEAILTKCFK